MKLKFRGIIIAFFTVVLQTLALNAQEKKDFQIFGNPSGLKEGDKVVLNMLVKDGFKIVDSVAVKNGEFHLKGTAPEGPLFFKISFGYDDKSNVFFKSITLLVSNGQNIHISGGDINKMLNGNLMESVLIEGSPSTEDWLRLVNTHRMYLYSLTEINDYIKKVGDSIGFDRKIVQTAFECRNLVHQSMGFLYKRVYPPRNRVLPFFLYSLIASYRSVFGRESFISDVYNNLDSSEKDSYYGKLLKEEAKLAIGQPFPDFTLPTPSGANINLKEVLTKSKIVLVHFWGANSANRNKYQNELRVLFQKYKPHGLNIVAISSDRYADQWKDIVATEAFPWYNVSDLKGQDGIVGQVYHEIGADPKMPNTTNVLINENGKIIAWNVSGVELQYYLDKYIGTKNGN